MPVDCKCCSRCRCLGMRGVGGNLIRAPRIRDSGAAWWALCSCSTVLSDVASCMHVGLLIDKVWGFSVWRFVGGDGPGYGGK